MSLEIEVPDEAPRKARSIDISSIENSLVNPIKSVAAKWLPKSEKVSLENPTTPIGLSELYERLRKIDAELSNNIDNPQLWRSRAEISLSLNSSTSALVCKLTAAILENKLRDFVEIVYDFAQGNNPFHALVERKVSSVQKGKLLAAMRQSSLEAEIHYALHLAFAAKFSDIQIFAQAVDSMRTGYSGEKRPFHSFKETQFIQTQEVDTVNTLGLLTNKNFKKIEANVRNFVQRIGCLRQGFAEVVSAQFNILLSTHLGQASADSLVPFPKDIQESWGYWEKLHPSAAARLKLLAGWPELNYESRLEPSAQRWWELLTMEKLKEISINDMFTGYLYKPVILYHRFKGEGSDEINAIRWLRDLPEDILPEVSDGKSLARAIYKRFCDGKPDWCFYFTNARRLGMHAKARSQRVLLFMVTEFGPQKEFQDHIAPVEFDVRDEKRWDIHSLIFYCDLFRLSMAYKKKIDEQRLFIVLLKHLPQPPKGWEDFRNAAVEMLLCLFLNGSPGRRFQLDTMLDRTTAWLRYAIQSGDETMIDEALTIMSYLEVGVLTDLVPDNLRHHQFQERRKTLWMEHARALAAGKESAWKKWISICQ